MFYQPLISIVMNCYNGEKYLDQAIQSVLNQNYNNWELIFWDNLSTDKSIDILNKYLVNEKRIKLFHSKAHIKLFEARNQALEKCSGEIVTFLDVDDYWARNKLYYQAKLFEDHEVDLVFGNFYTINDKTKKINKAFIRDLPSGNILDDLLRKYCVGMLTLAIRKNIILKYKFDSKLSVIGDFDLVIKIASKHKCMPSQNFIAYYRKHENSVTMKNRVLKLKELNYWYDKAIKDQVISKSNNLILIKNQILYSTVICDLLEGKKINALKNFLKLKYGFYLWKPFIAFFIPTNFVKLLSKF